MKLGCETRGDFQARHFGDLVRKYFEGGNGQGQGKSIASDIAGIILGLSIAWDKAEDESAKGKENF